MSEVIFNKNDYKILESLIERKCNAPASSLTIKQLIKITEMSLSKIRSVIGKFILMNFIKEGSKDGNNKTYFVLEEGITHFKMVFGFTDDIINEMISDFYSSLDEEE